MRTIEMTILGIFIASFLTAVGGVMRDILTNKIPLILVNEFYETVALS